MDRDQSFLFHFIFIAGNKICKNKLSKIWKEATVSYKLISKLDVKVSYEVLLSLLIGIIKHSQGTQVTILQYLYNISKKKLKMEFIFLHADKNQSFHKLALSFFMEVARHVQGTQNRKLVIFLQWIKKKVLQLFLPYSDAKHSDILRRSSHVYCYLLFLFFMTNYGI